jgi:hypothetical protein
MDAYIPLVPENFLVTYSDVVPGLRRFDTAGQLSITTKTVISTLASPMLCPTYSVGEEGTGGKGERWRGRQVRWREKRGEREKRGHAAAQCGCQAGSASLSPDPIHPPPCLRCHAPG